jgi:hypothetical protein
MEIYSESGTAISMARLDDCHNGDIVFAVPGAVFA